MVRLLAAFLLAACACDGSCASRPAEREPAPARSPSSTPSSAPAPRADAAALATRPAPDRLVAIGDLHGDLDVTRRALRLAGAIDAADAWIGGTLVVVQTGDVIDRGDDDRAVLDLLERLANDAKKAGGEVLLLSGNHELMNAAHDFRYVTPDSLGAFADAGPEGRASAFAPGGLYARRIAAHPIVVRVGDTVFVHGGVLPKHVRYGLGRMNTEVREWLEGKNGTQAPPPRMVMAEDGPVWTRMYSAATGREECAVLDETLAALDAKRMVVGHTPQRNGINPSCDDRVWRIDTGLSKFYGGKLEVLEIKKDGAKPTVLR